MILLLLAGCVQTWPDRPGFQEGDPEIVRLSLDCDLDLERWRLEVETLFWTGGGRLTWTEDQRYVEVHDVRSISAARDGSTDLLRADVRIVGDWREAGPGSGTAFHCSDDPSGLFVLYTVDGGQAACWRFGPDPDIWGQGDLPSCHAPEWEP